MKFKILEILKAQERQPLSGEKISQKLGVSRMAVWKHIKTLKKEGYNILTIGKKGYVLEEITDKLLPHELAANLKTDWLGHNIIYHDSVSSTNDVAKLEAQNGAVHGTVVVAEEQLKGKGRIQRGWYSPKGEGLWMTVVLRPEWLPQEAAKCTLLAAVMLHRVFTKLYGVNVGIKWPNDIFINGKKLVGILTEMNAQMDGINYIVIGMGINVNLNKQQLPEELEDIAISLNDVLDRKVSRLELFAEICKQFEIGYAEVNSKGFAQILDEWRKYSITLNKPVTVNGIKESYEGRAVDIDADGALIVESDGELKTVLAGDVSIRMRK